MGLFGQIVVEEAMLPVEVLERIDHTPALVVECKIKSNAAWRDMGKRWSKRDSNEIIPQKMAEIYADEVVRKDGLVEGTNTTLLAVHGLTLDNLYRLIPGARVPEELLVRFRSMGDQGIKVERQDFIDLFLSAQGTFATALRDKIYEETRAFGERQAREEAAARKNSSTGQPLLSE